MMPLQAGQPTEAGTGGGGGGGGGRGGGGASVACDLPPCEVSVWHSEALQSSVPCDYKIKQNRAFTITLQVLICLTNFTCLSNVCWLQRSFL